MIELAGKWLASIRTFVRIDIDATAPGLSWAEPGWPAREDHRGTLAGTVAPARAQVFLRSCSLPPSASISAAGAIIAAASDIPWHTEHPERVAPSHPRRATR